MDTTQTMALIPARGGSKGVPKKNLLPIAGYPLLAYSIAAAKACPAIHRVILTTDSPELAEMGRHYGAEVPFMRPAALAQDASPDRDYIIHAIEWQKEHEGSAADFIVQLRPTTPLRDPELLSAAIQAIQKNHAATSLRSVHALSEPPQKMMQIQDGYLTGFFPDDKRPEYFNLPRQMFPMAYHPNGYVDIVRTAHVMGNVSLYGQHILAFVTPEIVEIDRAEELDQLNWWVQQKGHSLKALLEKKFPGQRQMTPAGERT